MPAVATNRGLYVLGTQDASAIDLRCAVFVGTVPADSVIYDWNTLQDVIDDAGLTEAAVANYARQDVTGLAYTEDDTGNEVTWTADAMVINPGPAAGETWVLVAWYVFNASDSAADLIGVDEPATAFVTNGGQVTLPAFNATVERI